MIQEKPFERFMSFADVVSATAAASFFEQNGVPSRVEPGSPNVDLNPVAYVLIEGHLAHRARWLWAQQSGITDAELQFLATGELDDDGEPGY